MLEKVLSDCDNAMAFTKSCIKLCQKPNLAEINYVQNKLYKDMELHSPYASDTEDITTRQET